MKKIILTITIFSLFLNAGFINKETVIYLEKSQTIELIDKKKKEAFKAIDKYKETLIKKRKSLSNLLYQLQQTEILLKAKLYEQEKIIYNQHN